jgi:hypothetical protein
MSIEKVEIPKFKTVSAGNGLLRDVPTGEVEVYYRGAASAKPSKKRPRSRARAGRRNQRR